MHQRALDRRAYTALTVHSFTLLYTPVLGLISNYTNVHSVDFDLRRMQCSLVKFRVDLFYANIHRKKIFLSS